MFSRIFYSIRTRVAILYLMLTLLSFGIVSVSITRIVGDFMLSQRVREQLARAEEMAVQMAAPLVNLDAENMYKLAVEFGQRYDGRVLVLDAEAVVCADSFSALNGYKLDTREISDVLGGGAGSSYGFRRLDNSLARTDRRQPAKIWVGYFTSAITYNSELAGVLLFSNSVQDIVDRVSQVQLQVLLVFGLVVILSMVLAFMFSRVITRPIDVLTQGALNISRGDYKTRLPVSGRSELSNLIETFNAMTSQLESNERLRNEFVSNASHELKTPLSSIKVLIESMLYQEQVDAEVVREFLMDINQEIDRLNSIISDLLLLVHIDQTDAELVRSPMELNEILERVVSSLEPLARRKDIGLHLHADGSVVIPCDALKLQQAFSNIVDNAIKYTPEGGRVDIAIKDGPDKVCVIIQDNGIGIPEEYLPHIFERFYRVDKARSRDTGGTGLGLSIVQRIIMLHKGSVEVKSRENEGTAFFVYLPKS